MEQEIRFCKTSDDVRIAYAASGEGYPLLFVHGWASHLEFWPKMPRFDEFVHSNLAQHYRYYRHDARGWGLSDRDVKDFSIESKLRDVEAVVENAGLKRFAVIAASEGGPTAITYAVQNPERVSHLILLRTFARQPRAETPEEMELLKAMLMTIKPGWGKNTPEFRQLWTARFMPEADMEMIRWFNELQKVSGSAETVMALVGSIANIDVRNLLPQVQAPTLVAHCRGDLAVPFELGREIASMIPNARFLPLDSNNHIMLPGEPANGVLAKAITDFIGDPTADAKTQAQAAAPAGLVTILFTDMEGSTAMTQQLGDDRAQDLVREHNTAVRDALKAHAGREDQAHRGRHHGVVRFCSRRSRLRDRNTTLVGRRRFRASTYRAERGRAGGRGAGLVRDVGTAGGASVRGGERRRDTGLERRARAGSRQGIPLQRPRRVGTQGL
jgi:pimeloyl-ACP methyl ester carboxylesterase